MSFRNTRLAGALCLAAGGLFIVLGLLRDEHLVVLQKAAAICLECIGIG